MPKAQHKSVKCQKTSDTLTDRPKRATKRPHRYRQDERIQASDNESHVISDPDSDDSRHTLEARIRALESVIANRASTTTNTKQPETTPQGPLPSTSQTAKHSRSKNRARNLQQYHSAPISTDDEHSAKRIKKKRGKKSKRPRKSHDNISTDSSSDEERYPGCTEVRRSA